MTENNLQPICPVCHVGKLKKRQITFTNKFEGQLLVVPNVSALICDVCGETVIDQEILRHLSGLLDTQNPIRPGMLSKHPST